VSQSEFYTNTLHDAFGIPFSQFISTGSPRCDGLCKKSSYLVDRLRLNDGFDKVVLYLPTHRNWGKDFNNDFIIDGIRKVDEILKGTGICFLYKPHPNEVELLNINEHLYSNVRILKGIQMEEQDIYSYISDCDALISDYSSIIYDFLVCNKPIVLFAYDIEYYQKYDGGLLQDFFNYPVGPVVQTWEEMAAITKDLLFDDTWKQKRAFADNYFNGFNSGKNCKRLADYLLAKNQNNE